VQVGFKLKFELLFKVKNVDLSQEVTDKDLPPALTTLHSK